MYSGSKELYSLSPSLSLTTSIHDMGGVYFKDAAKEEVSRSLAQKGYNPNEFKVINSIENKQAKKDYLRANLETTVNHVFEDSVVSFTNYYQMNEKGQVISYPDGTVLHIDSDERGGLNEVGIKSAVKNALTHPHEVVLLYSPPGPVVFDDNPNNKFKEVKPYTTGQLYIMFSDGEKVNNVAVGVSNEGEAWVSTIMPHEYTEAISQPTEIEQVKHFITHPVTTEKTIDSFLDEQESQDRIIYKNKDKISFSLSKTLELIRQSIAGELPQSPVVAQILQTYIGVHDLNGSLLPTPENMSRSIDIDNITSQDIDGIYRKLAHEYMREKGIDTLTLGGSCGGTELKFDPFSNSLNTLSTTFRVVTQGKSGLSPVKDFREDPNLCRCSAASGAHFHCPGVDKRTKQQCKHAIVVGQGTTSCPACGTGKTC